MKKIFAMVLAVCMLISFAIPAVSAEEVQDASTTVTYDVPDSFMLSIPAQIEVGQPAEIAVPTLNLKEGRHVVVKAYGMNDSGELTLTGVHDTNNSIIAYMYGANGNILKPGDDTVGVFNIGDEGVAYTISSSILYRPADTVPDTYQGTLYFSAYSEAI